MPAFDSRRLPRDKQREIRRLYGDAGRDWIAGFPALVDACVARWQLRLLGAASAGYPTNRIFFAEGARGESLVLKVGYPDPDLFTEMIALAHYNGRGTPRLVDAAESLGAILMERIHPGTTFRRWGDSIARSRTPMPLIGELPVRCEEFEGLPRFEDWLARAFAEFRQKFRRDHPFNRHVDRAEPAYAELRGRHPGNWLLHGDLHHENILLDEQRGWIAIDPKGVIGPRPMECGRFLHNFLEDEIEGVNAFAEASIEQLCGVMDVRLETFAKTLGMTRRDLALANYADAVLSFCWTLNSRPEYSDLQPVDAAAALLER